MRENHLLQVGIFQCIVNTQLVVVTNIVESLIIFLLPMNKFFEVGPWGLTYSTSSVLVLNTLGWSCWCNPHSHNRNKGTPMLVVNSLGRSSDWCDDTADSPRGISSRVVIPWHCPSRSGWQNGPCYCCTCPMSVYHWWERWYIVGLVFWQVLVFGHLRKGCSIRLWGIL